MDLRSRGSGPVPQKCASISFYQVEFDSSPAWLSKEHTVSLSHPGSQTLLTMEGSLSPTAHARSTVDPLDTNPQQEETVGLSHMAIWHFTKMLESS